MASVDNKRVSMATQLPRIATAVMNLEPYGTSNQKPLFMDRSEDPLKLDWNESTNAPSPHVLRSLGQFMAAGRLNWYPDVEARHLRRRLSEFTSLPAEYISCFGGSDMALEYLARTYLEVDTEIIMSGPTYDNVRVYGQSTGATIKQVYYDDPFAPDIDRLIDAVTPRTRLIYVCNPNNPTGAMISHAEIERLLQSVGRTMVILDEAYIEFCGGTASEMVLKHSNLMVIRSFSKAFGLAALRIGYVMSDPRNLEYVHRIKVGKNVNALAQVAAVAALEDYLHVKKYVEEIKQSQEILSERLPRLGYEFQMTPANFFLLRVSDPSLAITELEERGIFVRDRSNVPQLQNTIRITIGNIAQTERLLIALEEMSGQAGSGESISTESESEEVIRSEVFVS